MKKFLLLTICSLLFIGNLFAGDFVYQVDLTSRYIFRGMDVLFNNKPAIQPSVTYNFGESGFTLNAFASFCLTDRSIYKYTDEIDLTLTYLFKTPEKYSLLIGFQNYGFFFAKDFTFKNNTTQEFFIEAGLPKVLFSPKLGIYWDINLGDGFYFQLSGIHALKINKKMNLEFNARLGYNAGQWIPKDADRGINDLTMGVALPIKFENVTISPFFKCAFVFLDAINNDNEFWGGISVLF